MARVLVHVEGQTEETFVNKILGPHLLWDGIYACERPLDRQRPPTGSSRRHQNPGAQYAGTFSGISGKIRELWSPPWWTITAFRKPVKRPGPVGPEAASLPFAQRAATVENALWEDIRSKRGTMGTSSNPERFIPFVTMHEFEGLLFSDCALFSQGIGRPDLADAFQAIRDRFKSPEEIDDSPETAPSKRVEALIPGYQKPSMGTLAVLEIGLDKIRRECHHFGEWMSKLEAWPSGRN